MRRKIKIVFKIIYEPLPMYQPKCIIIVGYLKLFALTQLCDTKSKLYKIIKNTIISV